MEGCFLSRVDTSSDLVCSSFVLVIYLVITYLSSLHSFTEPR